MDTKQLETQLGEILTQIKDSKAAAAEQEKKFGGMLTETKEQLQALQKQADALDTKIAEHHAAAEPEETFEQTLGQNDDLKSFMKKKSGNIVIELSSKHVRQIFERKTTIDSAAIGTTILDTERVPRIVTEARARLTVRDVLSSRPTSMQVIDFVKVNSPMTTGSPQIEGHTKKEAAVTFTSASERVRTIATWIPASKQILDDMPELLGFLRAALPYYVDLAEEQQLLTGSGSGEDLHGLVTQATAFNTALLTGSWTRIDAIGRAIQQVTAANELQPTFIVLHPNDWWSIRLTKDAEGRYILGDPMGPVTQQQLFGLTPVVTTSMTSGNFLVGSGIPIASEIRDRMGMQIEIATQHEDYFARNLVAIRAEKRLALIVYRPGSYIKGTFTTSP